jgi:hypothetical protein
MTEEYENYDAMQEEVRRLLHEWETGQVKQTQENETAVDEGPSPALQDGPENASGGTGGGL